MPSTHQPLLYHIARETHYWLRLLSACGLVDSAQLDPLTKESDELIAILTSIIKRIRDRK